MVKKNLLSFVTFFMFFFMLNAKINQKENQELLIEITKNNSLGQQQVFEKKANDIKELKGQYELQYNLVIEQQKELEQQIIVLDAQKKKIELYENISALLLFVIVLTLFLVLYVFSLKAKEKKLRLELERKNKKIEKNASQLIRQNKDLKQFAYIASHDLQEPLHTVSSFADFMIDDYSSQIDETGQEYLKYMKDGCKRMSNLIIALLDYSKIGVIKDIDSIKTEELLLVIKDEFSSLIKKTNTQITCGYLPQIYGYEVELKLLFQNLISNGIKFRKHTVRPKIHIEGKKLPSTDQYINRWQFSVKDNGIGIDRKHHDQIFSIFKRLHNREKYKGTGIGLAHCEKIVSLHNGNIWIFSKPNEGSTFYFTLQSNRRD